MKRIEDYAMIGDCRSAALVGLDGSIDWLCWPRFDSPACFAALLGDRDNGRWLLAPAGEHKASRRYRDSTLVLDTQFVTAGGRVLLTDFMPPSGHAVVRRVCGLAGKVDMRQELVLRFDYGRTVPWVRHGDGAELVAVAGPNKVVLRATVKLRGENFRSVTQFEVGEGDCLDFVLSYGSSVEDDPPPLDAAAALADTEARWRRWIERCAPAGPWTGLVRRSLLTLRGLTYNPTGGIVAAPTTSLPEFLGGERNWDYRYCWLRDATLIMRALLLAGFHDEARAWRDWLARAAAGSPEQLQIVYGVGGEHDLPERELPWLRGYAGSRPVRIGNAAVEQFQLDVFGELTGLLSVERNEGLPANDRACEVRYAVLRHLEQIWDQPDEGIWEVRGERRRFTFSRAMAWGAFHQAAGDNIARSEEERRRWQDLAAQIHGQVCREGFDPEQNCFVQSYGSTHLDASLLLLPRIGFLPAADPRIVGTIAAVERRLIHDGLVRRYESESGVDGLPPGEGVFLACSFWLVDCYVQQGRLERARKLFERLVGLCNDVGLLAEEYDPAAQRMLGNFPQAFSHVALIIAAYRLSAALEQVVGAYPKSTLSAH